MDKKRIIRATKKVKTAIKTHLFILKADLTLLEENKEMDKGVETDV